MDILITGTTGMVGSALVPFFTAQGHRVIRLVRRNPRQGSDEIFWDPEAGIIDAASLEGSNALVHLAGEGIAAGRWTGVRKRRIMDSRVKGTDLLARTLASLRRPPKVMISASAIGYYGDRGAEVLSEGSTVGSGFLADVCCRWEQAADPVSAGGIRLVVLRIGMILSKTGGALQKMLPPFRFGIGGRLGNGIQYVAWLALDDLLEIMSFALLHSSLSGAVNAVAPNPVTNNEFTKALGRVLRRPTVFAVPAFALRSIFGEMGEQVLLASARVVPGRLTQAGYTFRYPQLEPALRHLLVP